MINLSQLICQHFISFIFFFTDIDNDVNLTLIKVNEWFRNCHINQYKIIKKNLEHHRNFHSVILEKKKKLLI